MSDTTEGHDDRKPLSKTKLNTIERDFGQDLAAELDGVFVAAHGLLNVPDYAPIPIEAEWLSNYGHLHVGEVRLGFTRSQTGADIFASLRRKESSWASFLETAVAPYKIVPPPEPEPEPEPTPELELDADQVDEDTVADADVSATDPVPESIDVLTYVSCWRRGDGAGWTLGPTTQDRAEATRLLEAGADHVVVMTGDVTDLEAARAEIERAIAVEETRIATETAETVTEEAS